MPKRTLPTSFTVVRALSIGGAAQAKGAVVTASAAASGLGRHLSAYVSRGWLTPNAPQYSRTSKRVNQPRTTPTTSYSPREIRTMRGMTF